jgi:antirestriction protein ArdC
MHANTETVKYTRRKKSRRKPPTKAQREARDAKKTAVLAKLKEGIASVMTSDTWRAYCRMQASFHNYSFGNLMLIYMHMPNATRVAGFNTWKNKLGRCVKKGEKGIPILAPLTWSRKEVDANGNETKVGGIRGFKITHVFDFSQTEGDPLPKICKPLEGDDAGLADKLVEVATAAFGFPVKGKAKAEMNNAYGYWQPREKYICLRHGMTPKQRAKTMAHELAHACLGHGTPGDKGSYATGELEAESVAFIVSDHFGIDTSTYSFQYIAAYKGSVAVEALEKSGKRIQKTAAAIIDAIEATAPPTNGRKA